MEKVEVATAAKGSVDTKLVSKELKKKILVLKQNIHTLYKVSSFSDAIISERHTARGIHRNNPKKQLRYACKDQCPFISG